MLKDGRGKHGGCNLHTTLGRSVHCFLNLGGRVELTSCLLRGEVDVKGWRAGRYQQPGILLGRGAGWGKEGRAYEDDDLCDTAVEGCLKSQYNTTRQNVKRGNET